MTTTYDAGGTHFIYGTDGSEHLFTTPADDIIGCYGGNDRVTVTSGGTDTVYGGAGDDTLVIDFGSVDDDLTSTTDQYGMSHVFTGVATTDVRFRDFEHVTVKTGGGDDSVGLLCDFDAGGGVDTFKGFGSSVWDDDTTAYHIDMEKMAAGGQEFQGHTISNVEAAYVRASNLDDSYRDGHGGYGDTIYGLKGDDSFQTVSGRDKFYGGDGDDVLIIDWSDATGVVTVEDDRAWVDDGRPGINQATASRRVGFEEIESLEVNSGSGNDRIQGLRNQPAVIDGGKGRDTWVDWFDEWGGRGLTIKMKKAATANGLSFSDGSSVKNIEVAELWLTDRDDTFVDFGRGNDIVDGMGGDDSFKTRKGMDEFIGGDGEDTLIVDWSDTNKDCELSNNVGYPPRGYVDTARGELFATRSIEFAEVENLVIRFGSGDDLLVASSSSFAIHQCTADGGAGNDQLIGSLRNDVLFGGDGDDFLHGKNGSDEMYGGAGDDYMRGEDLGDRVGDGWRTAGSDLMYGNKGADTLYGGDRNDRLYGGKGEDELYGEDGKDKLYGGPKRDRLEGGSGNDKLFGDDGNDKLAGGDGRDWIEGGEGRDKLSGGLGADTFVIGRNTGLDRVYDFEDGVDHIGLQGVSVAKVRVLDQGDWALVELKSGQDLLQLMNVDADDISAADFLTV